MAFRLERVGEGVPGVWHAVILPLPELAWEGLESETRLGQVLGKKGVLFVGWAVMNDRLITPREYLAIIGEAP